MLWRKKALPEFLGGVRRARPHLEVLEDRITPSAEVAALLRAPLAFEPNIGQTDGPVQFLARGPGYNLYLTPGEAVLGLSGAVVRAQLVGANTAAPALGVDPLPGKSNYFIGNDPSAWHTDIANFARVHYEGVYPGIDLVYYGTAQGQLEYDFIVAPGADPANIRLSFAGVDGLGLDAAGNLILATPEGNVVQHAPIIYQDVGGVRQTVAGSFVLNDQQVSFDLGDFDPGLPLVIDPILAYSTFLGGVNEDAGIDVAVDGSGNFYLTGFTRSGNFPTANAYDSTRNGGFDAFVTKLDPTGSTILFSTFLGGSGDENDSAYIGPRGGIKVDASGNVYITGCTDSSIDFPLLNAVQSSYGGGSHDAFVAKIGASGSSLMYSTYWGGSGFDSGDGIAVDSLGRAYVIGFTASTDLRTTATAYQPRIGGQSDGFIVKLSVSGSSRVFATYLGGGLDDAIQSIGLDSSNNVYVTGRAESGDFPTTVGMDTLREGTSDAFVTKLNAAGSDLIWSTYLGGTGRENHAPPWRGYMGSLFVDAAGNVYVTGMTESGDFPLLTPYDNMLGGSQDAFVTKFDAAGMMQFSTYLGGSNNELGLGITVSSSGFVFVTGTTESGNFPRVNATQTSRAGSRDAFVSCFYPSGTALAFSTYLGGANDTNGEFGAALGVDNIAQMYVMGYTDADDFPAQNAVQGSLGGRGDVFLTKIHLGSITIAPTGGSTLVSEAGTTDTYTVVLDWAPTASVVVTLSPDAQLNVVSATVLTFTTLNWNIAQTVTVSAVNDFVSEASPHAGTISHSATSADTAYNITAPALAADITDNDPAGVTITPTGGSTGVTEGGAGDTYTIVLDSQPSADVVLTLNGGAQLAPVPTLVTFMPALWNVPQTVSVAAVNDSFTEGNHTGTIGHAASSTDSNYNGIAIANLTANITDNDPAGITVTPTGGSTAVTEGGASDTYTLVLDSQPTANVIITLNPGTQLSTAPGVITFLPAQWNVAQTVAVFAVNDVITEGNHSGTIGHSASSIDSNYNSIGIATISASITDNDPAGVTITASGGSTNVTEGGTTDTYTLVLDSMPSANVIVTLTPDAQLSVAPAVVTFLPAQWNIAHTVTVSAASDFVAEGAHTGVIAHTTSSTDNNYNRLGVASLTASITDNDVAGISVTPTLLALNEGGPGVPYSVQLTSQPLVNVVITLSPGPEVTVSSTILTFTNATWNTPQLVTVTAVDDLIAMGLHTGLITHTAGSGDVMYSSLSGPTATANITDNDAPGVTLSLTSFAVIEGGVRTYTAVLDLPPASDVILTITPPASLTLSPTTLTFAPGAWNIPQMITVTVVDDALAQGTHFGTITHAPGGDPTYAAVTVSDVSATIIDNEGINVLGTLRNDRVVVTNSSDLSTVFVNLNGKVTAYPSSSSQILIDASAGNDDIQIFNATIPIVVLGGQGTDKTTVLGRTSPNVVSLDDALMTFNGNSIGLFGVENVIAAGNKSDDDFTVVNMPLFNVEFRGDQGNDHLLGSDRANTWRINNPSSGTLNNTIKFSSIENLSGGASVDSFVFSAGKSIAGTLDGAGGSNVLDYSPYTSPIAVNLQTQTATGMLGFQNIAGVIGSRSGADRLIALDVANVWNITDLNAGDVNGTTFRGVENLIGGQQDDTFRLADNRGVRGRIDGAAGTNILDYSSYLSRPVTVNLQAHVATNLGGFVNIHDVRGGVGADTLIGVNQTNAWNLIGTNSGDVNGLTFSGFENLTGGVMSDSFILSPTGAWTGLLQGSGGVDSLVASMGSVYTSTGPGAGLLNGRKFQSIEKRS